MDSGEYNSNAKSLEEVLSKLSQIINENQQQDRAFGYFPTLYRRMTNAVIHDIKENKFADARRMEKLVIAFANLYFEAYENYKQDKPICETWKIAFDSAKNDKLIVLQHLLMGVNAHINYDLGIAASQICQQEELAHFKTDFEYINDIIESLINDIQNSISEISVPMRFVDFVGGTRDEELINFNIRKARSDAWQVASQLVKTDPAQRAELIQSVDNKSKLLSEKIAYQKGVSGFIIRCIRWSEKGSVRDKIRMLID